MITSTKRSFIFVKGGMSNAKLSLKGKEMMCFPTTILPTCIFLFLLPVFCIDCFLHMTWPLMSVFPSHSSKSQHYHPALFLTGSRKRLILYSCREGHPELRALDIIKKLGISQTEKLFDISCKKQLLTKLLHRWAREDETGKACCTLHRTHYIAYLCMNSGKS